jgi:hypothetical protein
VNEPERKDRLPAAAVIAAANALLADAASVEAVKALNETNISTILLRGPVVAHHLYENGETRGYADVDLLVAPTSRFVAETVLRNLGYAHSAVLGQRTADRPPWSSTWVRVHDRAAVDLHWSLVGSRAADREVWCVLETQSEPIRVLDQGLAGLNAQATALVVTLHAAHHGSGYRRGLADLQRALDMLSLETWKEAREIAQRLQAIEAFSAGLRLVPGGMMLAHQFGLPKTYSVETTLRAQSAPPMSLGFDWLARTPGIRGKLAFIAGKLVPDREFMQAWSPLARNGSRRGLAVAYAWRPLWLIWHSVPGFRAWLMARSRSNRKNVTPRA